ncbi:MAG TPA: 50S ribosomal protein L23 [Candidatus Yanofskybacteria bacterium]|uniref:Large ribosomal subunit protein uL23 n=1 Tax=Candidatus Yanofskybacteria bacterium GW2011_GWE2_40_11 TaxID=1619033 RepID=A0A0G0QIB3_9BACT|nr:MAG: 50S ribosomal protein L23 [Candidatus Yanofskybacteria bacterium GW2011_GWE1_40_10]KKR40084.1 MAG: 50S ribosomal protein L23 [Candidatus Yanofskybacteria bacterium GW2011_GWE2_40_11]HAU07373.1 50S ribosomal protein L23 [Candidatus Yanofskybacteria bacterium]HBT80884.1 50S ribosomal protein L23 [Candidatus Yanofskybacteria bacterium]HBX58112.1 50S ribosomal protein L23 [Candidatus Yanofskybacteria bacterium]
MKLNIFKNDEDKSKKNSKKVEATLDSQEGSKEAIKEDAVSSSIKLNYLPGAYRVLKSFYISEKATNLVTMNQYVFVVGDKTNKVEVKKNIEKLFDVKVKDVRIINMPSKIRNVGRHSGIKSGFKKAIVVLKDGYSIDQAKA